LTAAAGDSWNGSKNSLAYHRVAADEAYWSEHWATESVDRLLEVARHSPLSDWLIAHLPCRSRVLEAGCGLGQYVMFLAERGYEVTGVDYATDALDRHHAKYPRSKLVAANLSALPFDRHSFDAYISLGVIEHYREPPWSLLAEARRVLSDDGVALIAVPYFNVSRRLLARLIGTRERDLVARGAAFYQYVLNERALDSALGDAGFRVVDRGFYDPGRGLRDVKALLLPHRVEVAKEGGRSAQFSNAPRMVQRGALVRKVLYARFTLKVFAHMQIVCAVKSQVPPGRRP
jgi:SAM-dependent methyltransferase